MLMATWVVFSGLFDGFHLTLGVLSCAFVSYISSDLLFSDRSIGIGARFGQFFRLSGYFVWLLWQIVLSNVHLLKLAFLGPKSLTPQIVRYETKLKTDFEKFLLANSITLTPGTITVRLRGDVLLVHALSRDGATALQAGEMDRRVSALENDG